MSTQIIEQAAAIPMARPGLAMRRIAVMACFAAMLYLPAVARAQSPKDGFDPGANGLVSALAVQSDGKIVVGGNFTTLGGGGTGTFTRNYIGRLNPDGSLDTAFNPGANGSVDAVAIQADGKILVGGSFTTLGSGGTGSRKYLGRLNPDGSLDASFNPGANGGVKALAVQADGKILVGGLFTTMGGGGTGNTPRHYIGRLNADGSLDSTFNPGANNHIFALAAGADGRILVAGTFTTMGGGATGNTPRINLARLTATGVVDGAFNPGANDQVFSVATQPDGKIVVGGRFTALGGGTGITPASKLGRLNTDGSVDVGFNPGADSDVLAVVVQLDGRLLVGGTFTMLGGGGTGTTSRNAVGRLNPDGSLDTSFNPGAANVHVLATQAGGTILVGGLFAGLGGGSGTITRNNIGRLYADGSVDADFDPGADNFVVAMAVQPDGRVLVGGNFTHLGGGSATTPRDHIGRLNVDGSLDATFNPGANAQVNTITLQPGGKILVGGDFTMLGGGIRSGLGRLNTDGSLDSGFDAGANGFVYALAVQADGKILVGGLFTSLGGGGFGTNVRNRLGRLNPDGSLDATFDPGADGAVHAVTVQPDGKILVGGAFTMLLGGGGTGTTPRNHVGRLNPDGSLDTSFDPGANGAVNVATLQPDGMILLGGVFTALGGGIGTTPRNHLGRLHPDGSLDAGFNPGANDKVHALVVQADGRILVAGEFSMLGGGGGTTDRTRIGRLNVDGSVDPNFNPGASFVVYALAIQADGKVLTGGGFTTLGGMSTPTPRNFLARLTNNESASQRLSVTSDGSVVRWARGGAGPEISRATFESSTDGATFASLGSGTRTAGEWQLSGQSLPLGQNLFVRARGYHATGHGSDSIVESIWNAYIGGMTTCPTITLAPANLPGGSTGAPYSQTITQSGGGVATTAFALSTGALPQGLTLWTTGLLTGTPTQTGSFNFALTATDENGCSGSAAYTLLIVLTSPPAITAQPQSQTIASGHAATLIVSATGSPTLSYQWYQGPSGTTTTPVWGATASSYTTPALASASSYWVQVSNAYGMADSTTAAISVTIPAGSSPPTIGVQPQSQTIAAGQPAELSVGATGSATLTYQWYQGPSGSTTTPVWGATASSYATPALASASSYWVQVSNAYGTADSATASISVTLPGTIPPTIGAQPQTQTIAAGQAAVLSVGATGSATLSYQWYQGPSGTTTTPIAGATANSYITPALASASSYWVQVSNAYGTADSATAAISVTTPGTIPPTIGAQPQSQTIAAGQPAELSVGATGSATVTYQWYQGPSGTTTTPIAGATANSYITPALASASTYWVRVSNAYGTADSTTAAISVIMPGTIPPTIGAQPQSQTIAAGQAAVLSVGATGSATLTYQWYQGPSGTTTTPIAGATANSYITPALASASTYWVRVSNAYGTADSTTAAISVIMPGTIPPTIGAQPQSQTIAAGQAAVLNVGATGSATLTYQWYQGLSGTTTFPLAGATANSYIAPALASASNYWVRVSNAYGTADSNTATISIPGMTPPAITSQPQSQTTTAGQPVVLNVGATGSAPLTYQWYHGPRGTTTTPIAGATASSYMTQVGARAASYWVRVSNPNGTADSDTATITAARAAVLHDLDGDHKMELAVFRPLNGTWYARYSSLGYSSTDAFQWGLPGDLPISGDFDGDGKIELTVWRPSNGTWYIRYSSLGYDVGSYASFQWGLPGDVPLVTDFDGDGKTDLAVWRPSSGTWYVRLSSTGFATLESFQWGLPGDIPIATDFDDDGQTELAVWRPSNGTWYIRYSSLGYDLGSYATFQWGLPGDIPIAADFDGDGKSELTVFRPSIGYWFIRYSAQFQPYDVTAAGGYQWGLPGDLPVVGDFDGDGKTELAVYRPVTGEWWLRYSSLAYSVSEYGWYQWGLPGDTLVK